FRSLERKSNPRRRRRSDEFYLVTGLVTVSRRLLNPPVMQPMKPHSLVLTFAAASLPPVSTYAADGVAQPGGKVGGAVPIALVKIADKLVDPIDVSAPRDGSGRLF